MPRITWDEAGEREYETGVDRGVLYIPNGGGVYSTGVPWNGLTTVTESPSGAEATPLYADNIKYLNLVSAEQFGATVEAYMYPPEFDQFDGMASPEIGVTLSQQSRKPFGLSYRTLKGNDLVGTDFGYKIHMVYGAHAAPSERARATVNDTPEAVTFSWELTTTPVAVPDYEGNHYKPTAHLTVDSTQIDAETLEALEDLLYGVDAVLPALPLPLAVINLVALSTHS